jgi:hypothetical protein
MGHDDGLGCYWMQTGCHMPQQGPHATTQARQTLLPTIPSPISPFPQTSPKFLQVPLVLRCFSECFRSFRKLSGCISALPDYTGACMGPRPAPGQNLEPSGAGQLAMLNQLDSDRWTPRRQRRLGRPQVASAGRWGCVGAVHDRQLSHRECSDFTPERFSGPVSAPRGGAQRASPIFRHRPCDAPMH